MKSFATYEIFKNLVHAQKSHVLEYLDMMYGKYSLYQTIDNLSEKKAAITKKLGVEIDETGLDEVIFHYLSYYQQNNKFQNLNLYRQIFWDLHEIGMRKLNADDADISLRAKIVELTGKLEEKIELLINQLYPPEVKEEAISQLREIKTHEQRIKNKIKVL